MASAALLDLSSSPASAAILFSVLLAALLLVRSWPTRSSAKTPRLPPSPPKLPFIGNLHQLGPVPHKALRDLSLAHGPLLLLQLGQVPVLLASSAAAAEEILKASDLAFANRPRPKFSEMLRGDKGIGFAPYGDFWRQARKIAAVHLLSSIRVHAFRPAREDEVASLVNKVFELSSAGGAVDMSKTLSSFASTVVCRAVVGKAAVEEGKTVEIPKISAQTNAVVGLFRIENYFPSLRWLGKITGLDAKLADVLRRRQDLYRSIADGRKLGTGKDGGFLDVLLSLQADRFGLGFIPSDEEAEVVILGLMTAGGDTSYLVLERALEELVKNPAVMKKAREEVRGAGRAGKTMLTDDDVGRMSYLKAVVREVLRLHPPAPLLLPRESREAAQVLGYDIPAGTWVVINAWAIARDPAYWDRPEEFRPERFADGCVDFRGNNFQLIPFGAGRRICPGMHFAVANIELALANLLYHFDWTLPEEVEAEGVAGGEVIGLTVHKSRALLLLAKPTRFLG